MWSTIALGSSEGDHQHTTFVYSPEKKGPTRIPAPEKRLVKDQAMSMGSSVTSPDAAYVYTMVRPRKPPITVETKTI